MFLQGSLIIVLAAFVELPLVIIGAKLTGYFSNNITNNKEITSVIRSTEAYDTETKYTSYGLNIGYVF